MIAGDRRYFNPFSSQANSGFVGSSGIWSAWAQLNVANLELEAGSGDFAQASISSTEDLSVGGWVPDAEVGFGWGVGCAEPVGWSLGWALGWAVLEACAAGFPD